MHAPTKEILDSLPGALRRPVKLWFERLSDNDPQIDLADASVIRLARFVACSEFAANWLLRDWTWFTDNVAQFGSVTDARPLLDFVHDFTAAHDSLDARKTALRVFRNRYLLRVLWREIHGLADLEETLQQLSLLADRLLEAATRAAEDELDTRFGRVRDTSGELVPLVVLGMGKLGGGELNFSSDIDLIFCYPENGDSDGPKRLSAQEYFGRLTLKVIELLDEVTADGFVFRVDTRLRPFGDSGAPVVSFAALESYLLQHGRDWERYAYVKARVVGKMPSQRVVDDLDGNLIQPFVYRRYLDYGVFESLREMHAMIAAEVRRKELAGNIKLGPGGIREAEFVVQALQLVRGGTEQELRCRELQGVLPCLVGERGFGAADADELLAAYRFLRRLENFIQGIRDAQSHDLPTDIADRQRLCLALNYATWDDLVAAIDGHRDAISRQFSTIALRDGAAHKPNTSIFARLWETQAAVEEWRCALSDSVGDDAEETAAQIVRFMRAASIQQIDVVSASRLQRFMPTLIARVIVTKRAAVAMRRTLVVVERVLRRSAYLSLLNENHAALSRFVDLCEQNQTIARRIARYPILLDELLDPRTYSGGVSKHDLVNELQQRFVESVAADSEQTMQSIARFQRSTLFRIALSDSYGHLAVMKVSDALTWLAEAVLEETLRVVWADLTRQHGVPTFVQDGAQHCAGFGVIGYGKLGGLELSYASDLDLVFVHNSGGEQQRTNGGKPLQNAVFFARLARRLVHFLTTQTETGELYQVDTRLRPDGQSGLLVTSVQAFERYQDENAWTWEHQALLRARGVAGDAGILAEFDRIRCATLLHKVDREKLRDEVITMRRRMRKQLDRSNATNFDLKHGRGGIGDIEFLVQYLVLREVNSRPELIEHTDNIRQLDALVAAASIGAEAGRRLQAIYRRFRTHMHHLVLDGRPVQTAPDRFAAEREYVRNQWQALLGE